MNQTMLAVCLLLVVFLPLSSSAICTNKDDIVKYGMIETLLLADIIVYGAYHGQVNGTINSKFQVYCILKGEGIDMPENITTRKLDQQCSPTNMKLGEKYVLMITQEGLSDKDTFRLYEHSRSTSAAISATPQNLNKTVNVCGLKERQIKKPVGSTTKVQCPKRTVTEANCYRTDDTSEADNIMAPWMMLFIAYILGGKVLET